MKIFITGVNGFVGSSLAEYLFKPGITISGCSRGNNPGEVLQEKVKEFYRLQLNKEFSPKIFEGKDIVIHCAYSSDPKDILNTNINGTRQWYEAAEKAGVKTQLFFSSCSAGKQAKSRYGLIKHELETFFLENKEPVIKPGLILGNGGLFLKMINLIKSLPVAPLVDGGKYTVPVISMDSVAQATEKILRNPKPAIYNIFQPDSVKIKDLMKIIKRVLDKKCFFFPFPLPVLKNLARLSAKLKLSVPISTDSLIGLKELHLQKLPSSLKEMGIQDPDPESIIRHIINGI